MEYLLDEDIVGGADRVPTHAQQHDLHRLSEKSLFSHLGKLCLGYDSLRLSLISFYCHTFVLVLNFHWTATCHVDNMCMRYACIIQLSINVVMETQCSITINQTHVTHVNNVMTFAKSKNHHELSMGNVHVTNVRHYTCILYAIRGV